MQYGLLTLIPPIQKKLDATAPPREVVFIVDTSGSMEGTSIKQAKLAIEMALERLRPSDTFRIIRFSSNVSAFQVQAGSATLANINSGKQFVSSLLAEGGTEIVVAMAHALFHRRDKNRLTQIILMTDGAVGNEDALLALIHDQIQSSRLFTVGIGSALNGYLMTRAAAAGRGTYTFIENVEGISQQMAKLFEKLERPAMTNISLNWQGNSAPVSYWPNPVPDLSNGEPISVLAAFPVGTTGVTISGQIDGKLWSTPIALRGAPERPNLAALWARQKIKGIEATLFHGDNPKLVKAKILGTALKFGLVSRYTSLLAIDEQKAWPENEILVARQIATNLPDGWVRSESMKPFTNGSKPLHPMKSFDREDTSLKRTMRNAASQLSGLPQTATAGPLALILGLLAFVASLVIWRRREPHS
jgi:Ca-activated chloride channel family protein